MSLLNKLIYFSKEASVSPDKHVVTTNTPRDWERFYRNRWQHDKVVRSTHGVNCTGSCSWKIFVKNGLVTWELQSTDYPETRPDLPNHEPRGCPRGASYSWYLYSANRVKYPMIRGTLAKAYRKAKETHKDPVLAWESIMDNADTRNAYIRERGLGGLIRLDWEEAQEIIAAANIYTIKKYGPDRLAGFTPIPAMSMVSYSSGTRYLSLLGGTILSFYDFYCDLPPSSPQTWGEQTDVPESADWYNSSFLMLWGSNVPITRTPDAPFYTQVRYKGTKTINISPDFNEAAKFSDLWIKPKQGTDAALGLAMGHVILKEFYLDKKTPYFENYVRQYSDLPFLVKIEKQNGRYVAGRVIRASDMNTQLAETENADWKPVVFDEISKGLVVPNGTIGSRWDKSQKWNLEMVDATTGKDILPQLSFADEYDEVAEVAFPYFGGDDYKHEHFNATLHEEILYRKIPVRTSPDGTFMYCTVFDLTLANYGLTNGVDGVPSPAYTDDAPYTPAWQERITGVPAAQVISTARQFAENAEKTEGKSMIIIGCGVNQWFHTDMIYRSAINMLVFCGCVGQSGGGWSHYVGQEKLRPQTGWLPLAFALDWQRPPRHMNTTSYFYMHTNQWRYEKVGMSELISPLADKEEWNKMSVIDCNVKAERMGWLPSSPQLNENPLKLAKQAAAEGKDIKSFVTEKLRSKALSIASEDPDDPKNFPRNMFIWRSNLLASSAKGMEYFMKHLLGAQNGVLGEDLKVNGEQLPREVKWHDKAPEGKLDLLVTLDFRMSTSALHSDIVLPAATWYEKHDLSTTDLHPFIHPFTSAVDPVWEARTDWDIFKGLAKKVSELSPGHLGIEKDVVLLPMQHDSLMELSETAYAKDWKEHDDMELRPGKNMSDIIEVTRNYPETYQRFTALGPLMEELGNGGKGIGWETHEEVELLKKLNKTSENAGETNGLARIETDIHAAEMILTLAPETNGKVAVKAWEALEKITGRKHRHLAATREDEQIRFKDLVHQPRKIITSPIWSGVESHEVSYNAGYTNVHELIPWRTLTGRQSLYQDHPWMIAFGENLVCYKPPINTKSLKGMAEKLDSKEKYMVINMMTPHNKWTIHSSWSDNLLMLTLGRGGPVVWMSEEDARKIDLIDNDWVEVFNHNGATVARLVVSQRVPNGALIMYHNQERTVNMPVSPITGNRGGAHNSVSRLCLKPTHMIGGYAQLSYTINYYGTIGANRDEFVIIRKLDKVEWMDEPIEES